MRAIAEGEYGWEFLDMTETLLVVSKEERMAMSGDFHMSARGHQTLAEALLLYLQNIKEKSVVE